MKMNENLDEYCMILFYLPVAVRQSNVHGMMERDGRASALPCIVTW